MKHVYLLYEEHYDPEGFDSTEELIGIFQFLDSAKAGAKHGSREAFKRVDEDLWTALPTFPEEAYSKKFTIRKKEILR